MNKLISDSNDSNVYLIKEKEEYEDYQRYYLGFDINQYCSSKINLQIENYELVKFCNNASKN
jgi:hypothetical protein